MRCRLLTDGHEFDSFLQLQKVLSIAQDLHNCKSELFAILLHQLQLKKLLRKAWSFRQSFADILKVEHVQVEVVSHDHLCYLAERQDRIRANLQACHVHQRDLALLIC